MPQRVKTYLTMMTVLTGLLCAVYAGSIRNVILCIGDGMGPEQVKAARLYNGADLFFESFPYKTTMSTASANSSVTDSAAAATAMATGIKVNNGVISVQLPGDGSELETLLEYYQARGKSTGLVTTSYITHATPASFGAHNTSRNNNNQIAGDYLNQTKPNVLMGGGANGMTYSDATNAGYTVVTDTNELFALDTDLETFVSGQFGSYHLPYEADGLGTLPHLHQMAQVALDILDNDPDGFFLMLEGARIDHAGHANLLEENIHETLEFANTVELISDWMGDREDTQIIITADHETGGLTVTNDNGVGNYPDVTWSTTGHTATPVPVYAIGLNAHLATNVVNNTNIYTLAKSTALLPENLVATQIDASALETTWTSSSGDVYHVEQSLNLMSNNWNSISVHTAETFRITISTTNLPSSDWAFFRLNTIGTTEP